MSICLPNLSNIFIGDQDMAKKNKVQDGVRRHLEFPTNAILFQYEAALQTKFGANRSIIGRGKPACVFSR